MTEQSIPLIPVVAAMVTMVMAIFFNLVITT